CAPDSRSAPRKKPSIPPAPSTSHNPDTNPNPDPDELTESPTKSRPCAPRQSGPGCPVPQRRGELAVFRILGDGPEFTRHLSGSVHVAESPNNAVSSLLYPCFRATRFPENRCCHRPRAPNPPSLEEHMSTSPRNRDASFRQARRNRSRGTRSV